MRSHQLKSIIRDVDFAKKLEGCFKMFKDYHKKVLDAWMLI